MSIEMPVNVTARVPVKLPAKVPVEISYGNRYEIIKSMPMPKSNRTQLPLLKGEETGTIDSVLSKLKSFQNSKGLESLCIGFTSSDEGTGVSTIAARLAEQAAYNGIGKVVFVEANHAKASAHQHFRIKQSPGLLDHLCEGVELQECIQPTKSHSDFKVVAVGRRDLSSNTVSPLAMEPLLDELRSEYQLVIVDLPTIDSPGYGLFLAAQLDGVILVIDGTLSRARETRQLVETIEETGVPVVGAILNRYAPTLPKWLRRWF